MAAKPQVGMVDKDYGRIWVEFRDRALTKGCGPSEAREIHRRWKSIGKKLKAGRF